MKDFPAYGKRNSKILVRKTTVASKKSSIRLALVWIVVIFVALFFVQQRISYIRTEKNVRRLLSEKETLEIEILPLQLEERYLTQFSTVETIAKNRLSLQVPKREQIITYTIDKPLINTKSETDPAPE